MAGEARLAGLAARAEAEAEVGARLGPYAEEELLMSIEEACEDLAEALAVERRASATIGRDPTREPIAAYRLRNSGEGDEDSCDELESVRMCLPPSP